MPRPSEVPVTARSAGAQGAGARGVGVRGAGVRGAGQGADARGSEPLTGQELAWLAAWDRAGGPEGDGPEGLAGDDGPEGLAGDEEWLAGLPPGFWDEPVVAGPLGPPVPAPVEAPPGLMPRRWGTGGGFDAGGVADAIPPGPVLAGLAAGKQDAGLACAGDDELAGLMIAWRRIASWAAAGELAAVAELDRRRCAQAAAAAGAHLAEHVADEVAMVLTLTSRAAGKLTDIALSLARLPRTRTALHAGDIDVPKALVIIDELAGLDAPHAARVEASVIAKAPRQTTGELRRAARRAVMAADADAARTRKRKAARAARVECWQEQAGTTALAGRDLPPVQALAADQRISGYARWLKNAGAEGTLDTLRAQVYLALLNGQPMEALLPVDGEGVRGTSGTGPGQDAPPARGARPGQDAPACGAQPGQDPPACGAQPGQDPPACGAQPGQDPPRTSQPPTTTPPTPGAPAPHATVHPQSRGDLAPGLRGNAAPGLRGDLAPGLRGNAAPGLRGDLAPGLRGNAAPGMRGSVNLILPLTTWLGWSQAPGEVPGFGPLDAADSQAVAAALARDPATKWCLTITDTDGRAVAHGCAKAGPSHFTGEAAGQLTGEAAGQLTGETAGQPGESEPRAGPGPPGPPPGIGTWLTGVVLAWLETMGQCSHRWQSAGYRPSPSLLHLTQIRQQRCTAPGCRRPAASCDFEHTIPWHHGGRTCLCNGGPCCRRHHRCKQSSGWGLSQPQPGVFIWTTPHGRSYRTEPEPYPI